MRVLLIALTLSASAAFGQTTTRIVDLTTQNGESSLRVPKEPCDLVRTVNWAYNGNTLQLCSDLRFWLVSGTSCTDEPSGTFKELPKVSSSQLANIRSGTVSFKVSDLPGFGTGTTPVSCPAEGREDEYRLCASIKLPGGTLGTECGSGTFQDDEVTVVYDAKPPDAPTLASVQGLDSALSIRVDPPSDATEINVTIERTDGAGSRTVTQSADQTQFRVERLENNVTYRVTATAVDAADNESVASEALEGTPIFTKGFFDRYVEANGQEMGGCGAAGVGLAGGWVLAALGLWLSSRRNRS
jgi:uncharacterized protein (TIGR03382 family)